MDRLRRFSVAARDEWGAVLSSAIGCETICFVPFVSNARCGDYFEQTGTPVLMMGKHQKKNGVVISGIGSVRKLFWRRSTFLIIAVEPSGRVPLHP